MSEPEAPAAAASDAPPIQELPGFERLLADLSAGFINLPTSRIDAAISDALRRIVGLLDVDRANLIGFESETGAAQVTHSWSVPGVRAVVPRSVLEDFPWVMRRLQSGRPVVFSQLDELPPEAAADAASFRRVGAKSSLTMPMAVGGRIVGAIALGCLRHERAWPQDVFARAQTLADVFANALAHKSARERLEEGTARLDAIVCSAMDAIIAVDGDHRVVLFNAAAERMFGYPASRAIGAPLDHFIPDRFRSRHGTYVAHFVQTGETSRRMGMQTALSALRADGTEFPIEASISRATIAGQPLLTVILRDITERESAAREIDQALRFEQLLTNLSAGLLRAPVVDLERVVPEALRAIGEFLGVDRVVLWRFAEGEDSLMLMHWWAGAEAPEPPALVSQADFPWLSERLLRGEIVQLASLDEWPTEAAAERSVSERLGLQSLLSVPLRVDGSVAAVLSLAVLGSGRSWSEALIPRIRLIGETLANLLERDRKSRDLVAAQTEAAQFRERLAHLVRVHTMGEMSAALAHELNQPLVAIENYALAARQRIADAATDPRKIDELLIKVVAQATRAGDVVKRLRAMVKKHGIEAKEVDLEGAIRECVEMVKVDCELRSVRLDLDLSGQLPTVVADEIQIQQVLLNLLRNALDAMEAPCPHGDRVLRIGTAVTAPEEITVCVADRGVGIADSDLDSVFEPFFSTKSTGLGIGLSISRKIIEAHGGTLRAQANPGGGAVFRFTLPVATKRD
ncbi:ATP-binding protein [Variovorax sp. LARHSF232]